MKRNLIISLLAAAAVSGYVADAMAWRSFLITSADGEPIKIALSDDLRLKFSPTHLLVRGDRYDMEIPIESIAGLSQNHEKVDTPTGSLSLPSEQDCIFEAGKLRFGHPVDVAVYSIEGTVVMPVRECKVLDLSTLPHGVYLIHSDKFSLKIKI